MAGAESSRNLQILGPFDLRPWPGSGEIDWIHRRRREGAGHTRYMEPEWARDLREQCSDTGTAVFLKHM